MIYILVREFYSGGLEIICCSKNLKLLEDKIKKFDHDNYSGYNIMRADFIE